MHSIEYYKAKIKELKKRKSSSLGDALLLGHFEKELKTLKENPKN